MHSPAVWPIKHRILRARFGSRTARRPGRHPSNRNSAAAGTGHTKRRFLDPVHTRPPNRVNRSRLADRNRLVNRKPARKPALSCPLSQTVNSIHHASQTGITFRNNHYCRKQNPSPRRSSPPTASSTFRDKHRYSRRASRQLEFYLQRLAIHQQP